MSLCRSRQKWTTESLFERYWAKPIKVTKKTPNVQPEPANNPPKELMAKVGTCQIIIESAHVLDAIVYAIRDVRPLSEMPVGPSPKPILQTAQPSVSKLEPTTTSNITGYHNTAQAPPPNVTPLSAAKPPSSTNLGNLPPQRPLYGSTAITMAPTPALPAPPVKPSQDPVIQMLAQRASSNPELKLLMKVVASGGANPEQLKVFQSHIDDLTAILERQKQANNLANALLAKNTHGYAAGISPGINTNRYPGPGLLTKPNLSYQPPYQAQIKQKTYAPPKPEISGVAIEFAAGNGDRYLFPRHSILEYQPGTRRVKATFAIVRKGNASQGEGYDPKKEYYQPVTISIASDNTKVIETIFKGVSTLVDAQNHIEEVKARYTPADLVHLALQLPSTTDSIIDVEALHAMTFMADRRLSLLEGSTARRSSTIAGESKSTRASRKQGDWESLCQYCFISGAEQNKVDGVTVCDDCVTLLKPNVRGGRSRDGAVKHVSGPQVLMLQTGVSLI